MSATPPNHTLGSHQKPAASPAQPAEPASSTDYPRALYHKDSKPGALISKQVETADEAKALGADWVPLAKLGIETAPAAKSEEPDAGR